MSVDRPVDRQSGLGEILLFRKSGYLRAAIVFRVCILEKILEKEKAGALLHSKRLLAIVIFFLVLISPLDCPEDVGIEAEPR